MKNFFGGILDGIDVVSRYFGVPRWSIILCYCGSAATFVAFPAVWILWGFKTAFVATWAIGLSASVPYALFLSPGWGIMKLATSTIALYALAISAYGVFVVAVVGMAVLIAIEVRRQSFAFPRIA